MENDRWEACPPDVDAAELEWWRNYADLQDWLAWVQTAEIRAIIRRNYLEKILGRVATGDIVLELGCGTGWLLVDLARRGATGLVGTDFSAAQLEIAREQALAAGMAERIRFLEPSELPGDFRADVVICHGFLHHLTRAEIREVFADVRRRLRPDGELIVLEPVRGTRPLGVWAWYAKATLIFSGWGGLRPQSERERATRERVAAMLGGNQAPGRGPSPKEMPFTVGELESLAGDGFSVKSCEPVMFFSWTVAARLLLLGLTYPRLAAAVTGPVLRMAAAWERFALRRAPAALWEGWNFCLFRFERAGVPDDPG